MRKYSKIRNEKIRDTVKLRIKEGKIKPFKKGNIPWNKGKKGTYHFSEEGKKSNSDKHKKRKGYKHTDKTKQKISLKNKGKKRSLESINKMKLSHIGKKQSKETIEKRIKKGIEHYNWKGGISKEIYSVDWTKTLKRSIRERDKYICQICSKYGWCVHHIDYNKKNCSPENLITLCKSCHNKTNFNRDYWRNKFGKR
jgi:hypothetical protein